MLQKISISNDAVLLLDGF